MFRLGITAPPQAGVTKLVEAEIALGALSLDLDELDQLLARALHELAMEVAMCAPPFCEVLSHSRGAHSVECLFGSPDIIGRQRWNGECHGEGLEQDSGRVDEFEVARIEARDARSLVRLGGD